MRKIKLIFLFVITTLISLMIFPIYSSENTFTRKEMQDMVVSTALSYYYNNDYIDYNQHTKDSIDTINGVRIPGSYMWIKLNQTPEDVSRINTFSLSCSSFAFSVYKNALGYDFSDYYENNTYTYFKDGKYYPDPTTDNGIIEKYPSLYHTSRITQQLYQEMIERTGRGIEVRNYSEVVKDDIDNETKFLSNSTDAYINDVDDSLVGIYYYEASGSTFDEIKNQNGHNSKETIIKEISNIVQPGDLVSWHSKVFNTNGNWIDTQGHVVIYVGSALNDNDKGVIHSTGDDYTYDSIEGIMSGTGDDRYAVRYDMLESVLNKNIFKEVVEQTDGTITSSKINYRITIMRPINKFCKEDTCSLPTATDAFSKAVDTTVINNSKARVELSRLNMEQYVEIEKDVYNSTNNEATTLSNSVSQYNSVNVGDIITYKLQIQNKANYSYCTEGYYYQNYVQEAYKTRSCVQNGYEWIYSDTSDKYSYKNLTITSIVPNNVDYVEESCNITYKNVSKTDQKDTCSYDEKTRTITWNTGEIKPNALQTNNVYSTLNPTYIYSYQVKTKSFGTIKSEGMKVRTESGNVLKFGELTTKVNPTMNGINISIIKNLVNIFKSKYEKGFIEYNGNISTNNYTNDINTITSSIKISEEEYLYMLYYNTLGIDLGYLTAKEMIDAIFNKNIVDVNGSSITLYSKKKDSETLTGNKSKIKGMLVSGLYGGRKLKGNDNGDREALIRLKNYNHSDSIGINDLEFGDIIYTYSIEGALHAFMYYGQDSDGYGQFIQFESTGPSVYSYGASGGKGSFNKLMSIYSADLFWILRPTKYYATTIQYDYNGGIEGTNSYVAYNTYKSIITPVRKGYTFEGWYTKDGIKVENETKLTSTTSHTLYARWEANKYNISYDSNGGVGSMQESIHTYDEIKLLTANIFKKTGYTFKGWSTSKTGNVEYTDKQAVKNITNIKDKTITLYAVWEKEKIELERIEKIIQLNTNINEINLGLENNYTYKIYNYKGTLKNEGLVATGDKIEVYLNDTLSKEYTIIINGDVTGDGKSAINDVAKLYQYLKGKIEMEEYFVKSGNVVSSDIEIRINDVAKLYQFIKGKINNL